MKKTNALCAWNLMQPVDVLSQQREHLSILLAELLKIGNCKVSWVRLSRDVRVDLRH